MNETEKVYLEWSKRIRSIAQNGLVYVTDEYDRERYEELISIADAMASQALKCPVEEITASYKPAKEYVTPKVDVRAVVFNDCDEILLVREQSDGRWALPGGWADVGYSVSEVAVKEVFEESGLEVKPERLLALLDMKCHPHPPILPYVYKAFMQCRWVGGSLRPAFDILDCRFFPRHALPPLSLERVLPEQIEMLYRHKDDRDLPVEWD